ncbi:MAG: glycosyltransferase family 4 protein [Phycisphaerae bacterium]|nr:glycosyltransferase family 4 protein [Phycisphaerae bacterium]
MRICHLLASDTREDELVALARLMARLDADHFEQFALSADAAMGQRASDMLGIDVEPMHLRFGGFVGSIGSTGATACRPHLVHVWSRRLDTLNSLARADELALVLSGCPHEALSDKPPYHATQTIRRATVVCDTHAARENLIRRHCPAAKVFVLHPVADRVTLRPSNTTPTREMLDLPEDQPVLLTPPPPSRDGGHYFAVWATALLQQLLPGIRLILPGDSPEQVRLERFVRGFDLPEILVATGNRWRFDELTGLADLLLVPASSDVPTAPVVQAMTTGLPVVAGDVPSMREIIEHEITGLLVPPQNPTRLAGAALGLIENRPAATRLSETARKRVLDAYPPDAFAARAETIYAQAFARARTMAMGRGS